MEERTRTMSERTELGPQSNPAEPVSATHQDAPIRIIPSYADGSFVPAPRQSGESIRRTLLDLPAPRSITPINLGFSISEKSNPGHSPAVAPQQRDQVKAPPNIPGLRPDPRRPVTRPSAPTNENVRTGRESSQASTGSSISKLERIDKSSSEWEVLSDAGSRLNEGEAEVVEELQKKVDKRRSNFQYLADELAALDAQIRATEERLQRVHQQGGAAVSGVVPDVQGRQ